MGSPMDKKNDLDVAAAAPGEAEVEISTVDLDAETGLAAPEAIPELKTFAELGLIKELCEACERLKFTAPTEIQRLAIPPALRGEDVIGLAQTGSGKTAAFVLPVLQALWANPQPFFACILAPTRELVYQISQQIEALGGAMGVRTAVVVGGMDKMAQSIALGKNPHCIVATPGRLEEHLRETRGFSLKRVRYLVLDEADRLLDTDFSAIMDKLLRALPPSGADQRRTLLFSATMTDKVAKLQRASISRVPVRVAANTATKYSTVDSLLQYYRFFPLKHKETYLAYVLNEHAGHSAIVFTTTVVAVQRVAFMLRNLGFPAIPIHGQMPQSARLGALGKFRAGARSILVATDVVARGLDIPLVDLVINYDMPTNSKIYVHRVGRTARAGRPGKSITFVTQYDVELFQRVEALINKKMDEYPCEQDHVLMLSERVGEATAIAVSQMRELSQSGANGRGTKRRRSGQEDGDDNENEENSSRVRGTKEKYGHLKSKKRNRGSTLS